MKSAALQIISKLPFLLLFCCITLSINGQGRYDLVASLPLEAHLISADQLGNVYLVEKNNVLKYNTEGVLVNRYSNQRYGVIKSIDATDPYKIVVYYEAFRIIVILDNQLSQNASPLDMQFSDFAQPILACRAYNTGIWLYDQLLFRLYRLTLSLEVVQSTGNLTSVLGYEMRPDFMVEYNNVLYVNNPSTGILVFDQYGTYVKNIAIQSAKSFQITENAIYFTEGGLIKKYNFRTLEIESLPLPEGEIKGMAVYKNRIYIIDGKELKIYDYKE